MDRLSNLDFHLTPRQRFILGVLVVIAPVIFYSFTAYLALRHHPFFNTPLRTNGWAILTSVVSVITLAGTYVLFRRWAPAAMLAPEAAQLKPSRRIKIVGFVLAALVVAVCLPATFRAAQPRETQIFWHDEGLTLQWVQPFIVGDTDVPEYRFTQGWVTFLPIALLLKALNCVVPVDYQLTNMALRFYGLAVLFATINFTYRLIWQIAHSWWLAIAVVVIAYSRPEFFHICLAIDRPDTLQLLFVLLSLIQAHRFWVAGQPSSWFWAVFFAAFAFASKYSGQLLTPVLLLTWIAYWRRPEVQAAYPSRIAHWGVGAAAFGITMALVFPATFFTLSPYHLIKLGDVIAFFRTFMPIYKNPNIYNVPGYQAPSHLALWWGVFTSSYAFDYWLTILGGIGAALAVVKNVVWRTPTPRTKGEWLLLAWGGCYISFLVYQFGLVDYRYIMPAQFVLPFFLLLPILWLQQSTSIGRVPYRSVLGVAAIAAIFLLCGLRVGDTVRFLGAFRSEASVQFSYDVGRYLDRAVESGDDPKIMITNLVYVPPRFTHLSVNNVDVTMDYIAQNRFDYIVMTANMYEIYADKPTEGCEKQYCERFKVHYVDVVRAYTAFKNNTHPDYRLVRSFGNQNFLFERIKRDARVAGTR